MTRIGSRNRWASLTTHQEASSLLFVSNDTSGHQCLPRSSIHKLKTASYMPSYPGWVIAELWGFRLSDLLDDPNQQRLTPAVLKCKGLDSSCFDFIPDRHTYKAIKWPAAPLCLHIGASPSTPHPWAYTRNIAHLKETRSWSLNSFAFLSLINSPIWSPSTRTHVSTHITVSQ